MYATNIHSLLEKPKCFNHGQPAADARAAAHAHIAIGARLACTQVTMRCHVTPESRLRARLMAFAPRVMPSDVVPSRNTSAPLTNRLLQYWPTTVAIAAQEMPLSCEIYTCARSATCAPRCAVGKEECYLTRRAINSVGHIAAWECSTQAQQTRGNSAGCAYPSSSEVILQLHGQAFVHMSSSIGAMQQVAAFDNSKELMPLRVLPGRIRSAKPLLKATPRTLRCPLASR